MLLAVFLDEAWYIAFAQPEGLGAFLSVGKQALPAPIFEVALDCFFQEFLAGSMVLAGGGLDFRKQRRSHGHLLCITGGLHALSLEACRLRVKQCMG